MPTTTNTRPLHCGTCMDDLIHEAEKVKLDNRQPRTVCNSLVKLLEEGNRHRLNGDDEMAYIVFMRWIDCIRWLKKTPEYKKNKDFLKPYATGSQVREILDLLEDMSKSLKARYEAKRLEESTKGITNNAVKMQVEPDQTNDDDLLDEVGDIQLNLPDTPTEDPANAEPETSIKCMEMFHEMQKLGDRIIIIDIRDRNDFQESHIRSDQCMNIPPDLIKSGILATDIFRALKPVGITRRLIDHRAKQYCDIVVLLDWHTTKASIKSNNRLCILRTILSDWDPGVAYGKILVLDGGYREWLNYFPAITTNPSVTAPDIEDDDLAGILGEVEYPDLIPSDEDQPMTIVKPKPIPARSLKPRMNERNDLTNHKRDTSNVQKIDGARPAYGTNNVDIYSNNVSNTPTNIVDDTISITIPRKLAEDLNINHSKFSHNGKVRGVNVHPTENDVPKPKIDRSNKPNTARTYDAESEKMLSLLRQEKEVLKSWVKLENERLNLESHVFGSEDNENDDSQRRSEMLKQIKALSTLVADKSKQNLEIKEKLRKYKQGDFEVNPAYEDEKVQLQLDIGLAESDVKIVSIQRKLSTDKRNKKQEEILEMEQKNLFTPPREKQSDTEKIPLKNDGPSTNSALKRSYSSPNLAQLESREESASRGLDYNIPQVDRTSKPPPQHHQNRNNIGQSVSINRQPLRRDREQRMSPIFGDVHPGITGLKNLGNSCYMNSIIQCLSNTTSLARYFIQGSYTDDLNTKNRKTEGLVVEEVAQVIKALWCGHYRSISPRDLKVVIGQYKLQFENCEQQDSHEFLTFLLDWLHNDLKTKAKLEPDRSISNAEKEWDKAMGGQTSIISQLFFGQLRSTISCATCGNNSTTYENFNSLTLSLPDSIRCTLDDCIRKYLSGQRVSGWRCPSCKAARDATKKFDFVKLAPIIVVHLNRFGESNGWIQKTNTAVDFPLVSLDLRSYVAHESGTTTTTTNSYHQTYNLYAVSNHYGTMEGGHYTAYCNSASQNKWYKYDDHTVREVSPNEVRSQTSSAYLLFYTSVPTSPYMVM